MIGVINSLLVDFVETRYGTDKVNELKQRFNLPSGFHYRIDTYYSDAEWEEIYSEAVRMVGANRDEFEWDFGIYSGIMLVQQFPGFVKGCKDAREMIVRQPKIHNAIGHSLSDTRSQDIVNNKFTLEEAPDKIIMHYVSGNHMCTYYRSLATWVGTHFGEEVHIDEPRCQKRGDHECQIHVRFTKTVKDVKDAPAVQS